MCFIQVFQSYLVERIDLMKYIRTVITFSCFVLGDPAIGEGVNRFIFSMTTQKLKCGFHLNLGIPSGGQSTQIKYLSKSTDTYTKILLQ